jgi:hypothetical protein
MLESGGQCSLRQHIVCLNTRRVDSEQSAWVANEEEGARAKAQIVFDEPGRHGSLGCGWQG